MNKKRKIIISITLIVIALALFTVYILKSGSEKFAILDLKKVTSINDPALKTAIEATKECNKIGEKYRNSCYNGIAWKLGYYNEHPICKALKEGLKRGCYQGHGKKIGEKYSPDIEKIKNECSKTDFYEGCLSYATIQIGKESSKHIETEQCKKFEQEDTKQRCYEGFGRGLAEENKDSELCEKTLYKESCLLGYSYKIDQKGNRHEALQVCKKLKNDLQKRCYSLIGGNSYYIYNKSLEEAFEDCKQYLYSENCNDGLSFGIGYKTFEENQQKNKETNSVTTPVIPVIYGMINPPATKISLLIKQQIIPRFLNYRLVYLQIVLSSLGVIIIICVLKNRKVQELIKKTYEKTGTVTQKIYYLSTKELLIIYKESKLIIRDVLSIDKTTITSFSKELKTEFGNKEGKKKL